MSESVSGVHPDYAPFSKVIAHEQVCLVVPELIQTLKQICQHSFVLETFDPGVTVNGEFEEEDSVLRWMRDYQPIFVRNHGHLEGWNALSHEPNRVQYAKMLCEQVGAEQKNLPIFLESGNLQVAGRKIFISTRVLEDNARDVHREDLLKGGYRPRTRDEIIALLAASFGLSEEDVVILNRMPGELTGHVDLYLLPLSDNLILVPQIHQDALKLLFTRAELRLGIAVMRFLEKQAQLIEALGYQVMRLPMFPPLILPEVEMEEGIDAVFYSPANSILLRNQETDAHILVPTFDPFEFGPEVEDLVHGYEECWAKSFQEIGLKAHILDATDLGRYLGLFRCVTAVVPA